MHRSTTRTMARRGRPGPARRPARRTGFTLVELMVVVVILALLMALLLPAINGALRTARQSAVQAEINQLAQALESFKSKFGDYPPSRVLLDETGNYSTWLGNNFTVDQQFNPNSATLPGWTPHGSTSDITVSQLATRTITAFRKFWPRVQIGSTGNPNYQQNVNWYDFNGNGVTDNAYVLEGHECLVFFLGGIPLPNPLTYTDPTSVTLGVTGFGSNPANPFTNSIASDPRNNGSPNPMYSPNRQAPFYDFNPGRLFLDPTNPTTPGIPGYYDTLNAGPPSVSATGQGPVNFFAYFSAYGNGNYDPNDVNFYEADNTQSLVTTLQYFVTFPVGTKQNSHLALSPSPNPYTNTTTASTSAGTVTYLKPQTYQIISSGVDGLYGVGGQYVQQSQAASQPLPFDANNTNPSSDGNIRQREYDNLTNFKSGRLQ